MKNWKERLEEEAYRDEGEEEYTVEVDTDSYGIAILSWDGEEPALYWNTYAGYFENAPEEVQEQESDEMKNKIAGEIAEKLSEMLSVDVSWSYDSSASYDAGEDVYEFEIEEV